MGVCIVFSCESVLLDGTRRADCDMGFALLCCIAMPGMPREAPENVLCASGVLRELDVVASRIVKTTTNGLRDWKHEKMRDGAVGGCSDVCCCCCLAISSLLFSALDKLLKS